MRGRAAYVLYAACVHLIVAGCESPSSTPPPIMFAPDRMAIGPNPLDPLKQILYVGNPLTGPTQISGAAPSNSTITLFDLPAEVPRAGPIATGGILQDIAVSPDGRQLFVTKLENAQAGLLVSYSTVGGFSETARVSVPGVPGEIALSPIGNIIYIAASAPNSLLAFSSTTFTREAVLPLGFTPTVLGVSPTGAILVGNPDAGTIEYFTVSSSLPVSITAGASITVGGRPQALSFSPDGSVAYATVSAPPKVVAVDLTGTFSTLSTVPVIGVPEGIAAAITTSSVVFIANVNGTFSAVSFITVSTITSLSLGGLPRSIVLSQDGVRAYVSNALSNSVSVIDTVQFQNLKTLR